MSSMPSMPSTPDPFTESLLTSEPIYDGKTVHLRVDTVRLPNGHIARREIVRHSGAVAMVPVDADGNVILVRQYRHAAQRVMLEVPAGSLDGDESPEQGAIRELQEEAGYRPGKLQRLGGAFPAPSYTTEFIHLYLATELTASRLETDDDELIEVVRLTWDDLIQKITSGEIVDSKTISAVLLAKAYLNSGHS